jgi:hypothetical protein
MDTSEVQDGWVPQKTPPTHAGEPLKLQKEFTGDEQPRERLEGSVIIGSCTFTCQDCA